MTDVNLARGQYPERDGENRRANGEDVQGRLSQWDHAREFVREMSTKYPGAKFTLTGHSLGGALAQHVADEPSVAKVYAFSAPGFPGGGGYDAKIRHYDSSVPFFDPVQTVIENLGTRWEADKDPQAKTKKYAHRVSSAKGHGDGDTFPDAFSFDIRWPMIRAVQLQDDGVVSYSNHQIDHYTKARKARARAQRVLEMSGLKGSYFDVNHPSNTARPQLGFRSYSGFLHPTVRY